MFNSSVYGLKLDDFLNNGMSCFQMLYCEPYIKKNNLNP